MRKASGTFRLHTADGIELKAGLVVWVIDQKSKAYRGSVVTWRTGDCVVELRVMWVPPRFPSHVAAVDGRVACWGGYLYAEKPKAPVAVGEYLPGGPSGRAARDRFGSPVRARPRKVA